jgi:hypothetical protein
VNRNKRIDREKKLRLVDVHRRKTELYKKQVEQQKLLLEKIQKAENSETKKKLFAVFLEFFFVDHKYFLALQILGYFIS